MSVEVLALDGIGFGFGAAPVLDGVSTTIARGQFVAVVGPSGVGKSTLLRIVAGLVPPSAGVVRLAAVPEAGARATALVFQDARLLPWRTVRQNVGLGLEGLGLPVAERWLRVDEAVALVGLTPHAGKWPHQLSGGQRQRAGIARALAVRPGLLLVDEPFGALDAVTRAALQDELLRLWQQTGATILFVTHDLNEAAYLADRVLVLGGRPARIVRDIILDQPRPRPRDGALAEADIHRLRLALEETFDSGSGI